MDGVGDLGTAAGACACGGREDVGAAAGVAAIACLNNSRAFASISGVKVGPTGGAVVAAEAAGAGAGAGVALGAATGAGADTSFSPRFCFAASTAASICAMRFCRSASAGVGFKFGCAGGEVGAGVALVRGAGASEVMGAGAGAGAGTEPSRTASNASNAARSSTSA